MRPFEIALSAGLLGYIAFALFPWRAQGQWFFIIAAACLALAAIHVAAEGYRWQMAPVYLVALAVILHGAVQPILPPQVFRYGAVGALIVLASGIVTSVLAPVFRLPTTTGPFRVGTEVRHIVDPHRQDPQSDIPGGARELIIQIWYPADASARGEPAPYREKVLTTLRNRRLTLATTNAILRPPVSASRARYPVLVYSPSWRGQRTENTYQAEELASHGYIVVGLDHPYSTSATAFPDGRIAHTKLVVDEDYSSEDAFHTFLRAVEEQAKIRSQDAIFALDALTQLDLNDGPDNRFTGRLDLDRVGIFGFSFGGTVAAEVCRTDRRFHAGISLDGMLAEGSARHGTRAPFFFIVANDSADPARLSANADPASRREVEFARQQKDQMHRSLAESGGHWMTVPGTAHTNFSDLPFFSPLRSKTEAGPVDRERTARVVGRYILAFFDQQLNGIEQPLLSGPSPDFPEVRFQPLERGSPPSSGD